MNLDLDISAVTGFFRKVLTELREKRLWPVAVALLVAIVAVPVALMKSSSPAPVPAGPAATPPPPQATSLPTISDQSTPSQSRLTGRTRNPFTQQSGGQSSTTSATTATATATATHLNSTATATGGSTAGGASGTTGVVVGFAAPTSKPITPPSITPGTKPKPAPSGLTSTQSYDVTLAITNASGGLNTIDSLERLSALPSNQMPMVIELGVLQGGSRVLFAVQPGTTVNGPGECTPGPIDCEILSLAPGQTEGMSRQTSAGVIHGPLFAVTGISATNHPSAAAARGARRLESPAGRQLLAHSTLTSLSLFQYQPGLGAMVDLRNLTVGGS